MLSIETLTPNITFKNTDKKLELCTIEELDVYNCPYFATITLIEQEIHQFEI